MKIRGGSSVFYILALAFLFVSSFICFAKDSNHIYDANGNLISGDGFYRVYNSLNQLWKVYNGSSPTLLLEEYAYHPLEERVLFKKVYNNDSSLKETVYYVDEDFVRVVNASGTYDFTYIYQDGVLVAQVNPDGSKYYIQNDHLGSSTVVTNSSGGIKETTFYSPYGEISSGGSVSRYDYTGQEYDSVIGDYDYNARRYKANLAQFVQPDVSFPNVYDPQQLNRYAYAKNNPYRYIDESGHIACSFWEGCYSFDLFGINFIGGNVEYHESDIIDNSGGIQKVQYTEADFEGQYMNAIPVIAGGYATSLSSTLSSSSLKGQNIRQNSQAGKVGETKALNKLGLEKNTKVFTTIDPKTGKSVSTIPDAIGKDGKGIFEVKNSKYVTNTKQIRAEANLATQSGQKPNLITGTYTKISKSVTQIWNVIRVKILGPAKKTK
jgi:RHS repeat-associated protein